MEQAASTKSEMSRILWMPERMFGNEGVKMMIMKWLMTMIYRIAIEMDIPIADLLQLQFLEGASLLMEITMVEMGTNQF